VKTDHSEVISQKVRNCTLMYLEFEKGNRPHDWKQRDALLVRNESSHQLFLYCDMPIDRSGDFHLIAVS
jgi:hypothetical protein